jgi:hypothetical protein
MTQHSQLNVHRNSGSIGDDPTVHRAGITGPILSIVAAAVVLVMVAESRLTPEQRLELFEASHSY